ncbi:RHS repeat protein, partial [Methylocucumis oryzae]|uniref:RHS repeat protein n=1 Tax=Methylocucumis oryzae TaxID=1632867 RepID=UPI00103CDC76
DHHTQDSVYASGATTPSTVVNRRFDALGRLWQVLNAANQVVREYQYDAQGNLRRSQEHYSDTEHAITDYHSYDTLNRLTQVTDALNGESTTSYDGADHIASVTDARNNRTDYSTDGLNNPLSETSSDRGVTQNTNYDPAGNLKNRLDARYYTATYNYDALNRITSIDYQPSPMSPAPLSPALRFNYRYDGNPNPSNANAVGHLSHSDDPTGSNDWNYDNEGRLQSKTQRTQGIDLISRYAYDSGTGRLNGFTYPSGATLYYQYDTAGRINAVRYSANAQTTEHVIVDNITYQPLGAMTSYRLPTVTGQPSFSRVYDADGYLTHYTLNEGDVTLVRDRQGNIHQSNHV